MIRNRSAIVGIAHTEYVRSIGRSERETAREVALGALADAGLAARDVDGIFYVEGQEGEATDLARRLGVDRLRSVGVTIDDCQVFAASHVVTLGAIEVLAQQQLDLGLFDIVDLR